MEKKINIVYRKKWSFRNYSVRYRNIQKLKSKGTRWYEYQISDLHFFTGTSATQPYNEEYIIQNAYCRHYDKIIIVFFFCAGSISHYKIKYQSFYNESYSVYDWFFYIYTEIQYLVFIRITMLICFHDIYFFRFTRHYRLQSRICRRNKDFEEFGYFF